MDILITLLDHGRDDLEEFDSAEFVLNHSQWISVVTGTSSVYGVLEETHLTSTHPFNIPKPGITLGNVEEKPGDGEATTSRSMGSNLYTRALRGAPLSVPTGNTHAP